MSGAGTSSVLTLARSCFELPSSVSDAHLAVCLLREVQKSSSRRAGTLRLPADDVVHALVSGMLDLVVERVQSYLTTLKHMFCQPSSLAEWNSTFQLCRDTG